MRLTLLAVIGILSLAYAYALDDASNSAQVILLEGPGYSNEGPRSRESSEELGFWDYQDRILGR
ncbi:uncharacterized protein LOC127011032 [Drosophila biarmipes]|uniref:uncharacterized protein LOC127011032 n=1 Tax=Drosophila biarmipes TaxID=125945 RepID=UPI0021CD133B|nr:uncharacterized protein LOC127011032 [Drosophila biarmipes]